jgi:hypothetical protein
MTAKGKGKSTSKAKGMGNSKAKARATAKLDELGAFLGGDEFGVPAG